MNGAESGRETAERSPVFVDASGRRRRGVTVLGYLGASACTAYLAAFGITVSTHAGVIDASGVALAPSPSIDERGWRRVRRRPRGRRRPGQRDRTPRRHRRRGHHAHVAEEHVAARVGSRRAPCRRSARQRRRPTARRHRWSPSGSSADPRRPVAEPRPRAPRDPRPRTAAACRGPPSPRPTRHRPPVARAGALRRAARARRRAPGRRGTAGRGRPAAAAAPAPGPGPTPRPTRRPRPAPAPDPATPAVLDIGPLTTSIGA